MVTLFEPHGPYRLKKRFRHDEAENRTQRQLHWTKYVLNIEEGSFLGYTPKRLIQITIFYICFYMGLAILYTICYQIFQVTISNKQPTIMRRQPSLSFAPCIENLKSRLIEYDEYREETIEPYIEAIEKFLNKYGKPADNEFGACSPADDYGYKLRRPCVFLKLNRVIGFTVQPIDNIKDVPLEAPDELKQRILGPSTTERLNKVWLTCESEPKVKLNLVPHGEVLSHFVEFPEKVVYEKKHEKLDKDDVRKFYDQADHKRIVALQLVDMPANVKVKIKCYAWGQNIVIARGDFDMGAGWAAFQIKIKS